MQEEARSRNRKRKADTLGRLAAAAAAANVGDRCKTDHPTNTNTNTTQPPPPTVISTGRGAVTGWTTCPLCQGVSQKRYALGRGIATHLHAVHTPWKPGKAEKQKRKRIAKRRRVELKRKNVVKNQTSRDDDEQKEEEELREQETWGPSQQEIDDWDEEVLKVVADLETKAAASKVEGDSIIVKAGLDRNGETSKSYRESLPPFLQAAADGDLPALQTMVQQQQQSGNVRALLDLRDRNQSCAEHWAAGGGHLSCLKFLFALRQEHAPLKEDDDDSTTTATKKMRRRDGKTCLHYAARNGHLNCIKYLIEDQKLEVDRVSGDGTTPLHMACFGGHFHAVQYLVEHAKADIAATNEWGCSAAHWVAMSKNSNVAQVRDVCDYLLQRQGVSFFVQHQKQGHCALHKAAQRRNRHVIEWMAEQTTMMTLEQRQQAGRPDEGGHCPSEIWLSVGGSPDFAKQMQDKWGW